MADSARISIDADPAFKTQIVVDQWLAGDHSAFEVLILRFEPLIARRIRRHSSWPILGQKVQVEDVSQEVWMRLMASGMRTFKTQGEGSFLAYLGRMTDNMIVDLVRKAMAVKRNGGQMELSVTAQDAETISESMGMRGPISPTSSARFSELVELASRLLNDREMEAWKLVEIQEYTTDEAGFALGCSGSAVRGLISRGRAKLIAAM